MELDTAHLASLFEHATEGIILTNSKGKITLINPAAERMFNYDAEQVIGKPIADPPTLSFTTYRRKE